MAAAPHFPGGGVHAKGQAGEVVEWGEGVGRGRGAVGEGLGPSARVLDLDTDRCHSLTQTGGKGAPGGTCKPGGAEGSLAGLGGQGWGC